MPDGFVILPTAFDGDNLKPEAWMQVQAHLDRVRKMIQKAVAGTDAIFGVQDGLLFNVGGRTYSNLSYGLKLRFKKKMADATRIQDALSAEIVENLDDSYTAAKLPRSLKGVLVKVALKRGAAVISDYRRRNCPRQDQKAL